LDEQSDAKEALFYQLNKSKSRIIPCNCSSSNKTVPPYPTLLLPGKTRPPGASLTPQNPSHSPLLWQNYSHSETRSYPAVYTDAAIRMGIHPINGPPEPPGQTEDKLYQPFKSETTTASPAGSCNTIPDILLASIHPGTFPSGRDFFYAKHTLSELYAGVPENTAGILFFQGSHPANSSGAQQTIGLTCPDDISTYTDINTCESYISGNLDPQFDEAAVVRLTWEMTGATEDASPPQGIHRIGSHTFSEGHTTVTYTATGVDGTTATCSFSVTISDNQVPRLENMPPDITVVAAPGNCSATAFWFEPTATDNCTPAHQITKEGTARPGDLFPVGATRVYYTAWDAMGNESTVESFTVTVEDRQPPVLTLPPDLTVQCGDPLPAPWTTVQQLTTAGGSATDNCSPDQISFRLLSETPSSTVCPYTLTRVYRIADAAGNTTTTEHRIFVEGEGEMVQPEEEEEVRLKGAMDEIISTTTGGPWEESTTWVGEVVPGFDDNVTIAAGAIVTVTTEVQCRTVDIEGGGRLEISTGGDLSCTQNVNLTVPQNAELVLNGGSFSTAASLINEGLIEMNSGSFSIGQIDGNSLQTTSNGTFEMSGGELNLAARFYVSGGDATISGGTVNLSTLGHSNSTHASFHISANTDLTVSGSAQIVFHNPNSGSAGDLLIFSGGSGTKNIGGGTFIFGSNSTGSSAEFVVNSPFALSNVTINSHNNPGILISGNDLTISGELTMNGGNINATSQDLIIASSGDITRSSGFVIGNLQRAITGSGTYLFPVGNGNNYTPLELTFNSLSSGGNITVSSNGSEHPNIGTSLLNSTQSVNNYWTINNSGVSFSSVDGTFGFPSGLADGGDYLVGMFSGSSWSYPNTTSVSSTSVSFDGLGSLPGTATFALAECEPPTIALGTNPVVCEGTVSTELPYSAVTGSPVEYSIDFDATAEWQGFSDVPWTSLPASPISISVPGGASPGTYNATLIVRTEVDCESTGDVFTITIDPLPTASAGGSETICENGTATVTGASASNGTVLWSHNGNGSIANETTLTPTYTAAAGDAGNTVTLTMTVTSNNSCGAETTTATYTVNVEPLPTASAGGSETICENGTATVSGASASNGTVLWSHNGNGSLSNQTTLTPTYTAAAGDAGNSVTLTMTVTSNNSCGAETTTATYTVNVEPLPTASAGGSETICENGTATVSGASASNGTVLWTHNGNGSLSNQTTLTPTYTAAAGDAGNSVTLTMTVTSNNSCGTETATATYTVNVEPLPTASAGGSETICENGTATVSGASASNGTVLWTHNGNGSLSNQTTLTPTYTAAAGDAGNSVTLTMTVTSNNSCGTETATATYTVNVEPLPTASAGGSETICENGTATVSGAFASNGTILWTHNGNGSLSNQTTLTPTYTAAAGDAGNSVTLTMTVTSNNSCGTETAIATYTVNVEPLPAASAGGGETICENGFATVTGASASYGNILWSHNGNGTLTGQTTLTPTYTAAAGDAGSEIILTMTVTSDNNCSSQSASAIFTITVRPELLPGSVSSSQTICYNTAPEALVATEPTGGSGPYSYQWQSSSDGSSWSDIFGETSTVFNPPALTSSIYYRVVYTDAGSPSCGTVESYSAQITVTPELLASIPTTPEILCNNGSATVTISVTGGTQPYSYTFNGVPDADGIISNVGAGTYAWSVTDARNCGPVTETIVISEPTPISILSASVTSSITCNGGTATVKIEADGGTGILSYTFNGQTNTTGEFAGVYAGTGLSYSVTDANGCGPVFGSIDVTEPSALSASAEITSEIECNGETATVRINASGGTGDLEYTFNGVTQSSNIFTGITPGSNIQWSVTDANNCGPVTGTLTVTQPNALTASVSETSSITCFGGTADIRITASGGTGIKTYSFDGQPDNTTGIFLGIIAGTYNWRVEDENGCFTEGTYEVQQPTEVEITSIGSNSEICQGETLTLNSAAQGGTGNRTFSWTGPNGFTSNSPNPSIGNATPAASGPYTLVVTDANGCTAQTTTNAVVHATPTMNIPSDIEDCHGTVIPAITLTGASDSYDWEIDDPSIGFAANSGTNVISEFTMVNEGNTPVTATITVTPSITEGCEGLPQSFTITVNPIPEVEVTNNSPLLCNNGETNIVLSSNISGTTYAWTASRTSGSTTGFPASGTGNIIQHNLTGAGTVEYLITPTANGCPTDEISVSVQVISSSFDLDVNILSGSIPSIACPGQNVFIEFNGNEESTRETEWETRFEWTSSNPNVGLSSSSGTTPGNYGNISFTTQNLTDEDQVSTITIIPVPYYRSRSCVWFFGWWCSSWSNWQRSSCSGNAESFTITVYPFRANCPTDYNVTTDPGVCTATFTPDPPSFECSPQTLTWSMSDGSSGTGNIGSYAFETGTTTVTYEAQDDQGNNSTCSFTVTVTDDEAPVISNCPTDFNVAMDVGECGAVISWTEPTVTDNCDVSPTLARTDGTGFNSGDLFPAGTTTISYSVTDAAGNVNTCSFDVTVAADDQAPVLTCIGNTTVCAPAGGQYVQADGSWDATYDENCSGNVTLEYTLTGATTGTGTSLANTSFNVGNTTVEWTATDNNSNVSTCSYVVTVNEIPAVSIDQTNPSVCLIGSITLTTTSSGTPAPTYQWYKDGVAIAGATGDELNLNNVQETDAGSYTVEVSNSCGAAVSAPAVLTVSTPPVITAQPASQTDCYGGDVLFSVTATGGEGSYTYQWKKYDGSNWNDISGATSSTLLISNIGNTENPDQTQYQVIVTDACGITATSSVATLTVNQLTHSLVSETVCQGGNTAFSVTTSGSSPVSYEWLLNGSPISNGGPYSGATSQTLTITNAQVAQNGTYTVNVTFNITQPNDNGPGVTTCQMSAEVGELIVDEGPDIVATPATQTICPGSAITDIILSNANGTENTTYTWTRDNTTVLTGISESDSGETISGTLFSLDPGTTQTTTFFITATANGCESTGTVTVTVVDNEAPVVNTCPSNIPVGTDAGVCGAVVTYTPPTFDDNCDGTGLSGTLIEGLDTGETFPVGTTTVTWEYTDAAGNGPATCSFDVTVTDNVDPIAICQDITVQLDASGNATITAADVDNGSSDNCGTITLSLDNSTFGCSDVGPNTVTLTVEDGSGNFATCEAIVTVEDNIDPDAVCQNITVELDETGTVSITPEEIDNGSSDNCGIASLSLDQTDFDCDDVGENTVVLTVTDNNGNISTCNATVTVEDNIAPTALCKDITVQLDATGQASITTADIDNGSYDNCGIATMEISQTTFSCSDTGDNNVTLTVTDVNGNVSTCTATVTIEDTEDPVALCRDITVQLDASGNASITPADIDFGSSDNCGTPTLGLDITDFDCTNVGSNTVTLTATDNYGNTATCTATVTVEDNVNPDVICQDITVQLDASGSVTIAPADIDNGSTDNCGIASLSLDKTDFDCTDVGENTVVLTVTDNNGNISTCNATVTVEDNIAPTALCKDITVQLDASGQATITANDINDGSYDNCGIATMEISLTTFSCSDAGDNNVTLTVTDVNGNVSTCTATVTIEDTENPVAVCQDITIQLDASGNASITPADIDNGSSDNCGTPTLSLEKTDFNCTELGTHTVTLTATDASGNSHSCTAIVTVADNDFPVDIDASVSYSPIDCFGETTTVTITLESGGVGTLTYWLDGNSSSTGVFENVPAGTYSWSVTNPLGCGDFNSTVDVTQPDELTADILNTDVTCSSGTDGSIAVSNATGGTGSYEYSIDGGANWQASPSFTGLVPDIYHVMIRDENGCEVTLNPALEVYILTAVIDFSNISCFGADDGRIDILNPAGGSGVYNYSIDGGANWHSDGNFTDLEPGSYNVQIQDANESYCVVVLNDNLEIGEPDVLSADLAFTDVTCFNAGDGTITVSNPAGGYGTYHYSIDGGLNWQSSGTFTSLAPGFYDVRMRDASQILCELVLNSSLELVQPAEMNAQVNFSNVTCFGEADGTISISSPQGGSGDYEYSIDGGASWQVSGNFIDLPPGNYNVQIRDANATGCVIILNNNLEITQPPALTIDTQPTDINDCYGNSATSSVGISGGAGTIGYQWEKEIAGVWTAITDGGDISGATTANLTISNISSTHNGLYRVVVSDLCSSVISGEVTLTVNEITALTPAVQTSEICEGDDFTFEVTTSGSAPTGYQWQVNSSGTWNDLPGETGSILTITAATPAESGEYRVVVTFPSSAGPGCSLESNVLFERHLVIHPTPTVDDPGPLDFCDVSSTTPIPLTGTPAGVVFDITGGTAIGLPDQSGVTEIPSFSTIEGTATLTITPRANNCTGASIDVEVTVAPKPTVTAPVGVIFCNGIPTDPYPLEGTPDNVRYDITGGAAIGLADVTDVDEIPSFTPVAGTATITVIPKVLNCTGTPVSFTITVRETPTAAISGGATVCRGATAPVVTFTNPLNAVVRVTYSINGAGSHNASIPANSSVDIAVPTSSSGIFVYELVSARYITEPYCENPVTGSAEFNILEPVVPTLDGPNEMCAGTTGNVYTTEAGMTNYIWSISSGGTITAGGGSEDNTITITWDTQGTKNVSVRYTDTNACSASSPTTYPVTVHPLPVITITGPATICANTTPRVYTTQTGMSEYDWDVSSGGTITSGGGPNDNTVTVLWHTAGAQTVSVNYTNPNGCEAAAPRTNNITVLPEPVVTLTGVQVVCEGSSGHVYTTEAGMTNYVWVISAGGAIISGGTVNDNTATVRWNSAGPQTISVNYSSADGCSAQAPAEQEVTVNPKPVPTIAGPGNLCAGSEEYLYTTQGGMDNYTWIVSAGGTVTGGGGVNDDFVTVRWEVSGTQSVSVNYENSYGCPAIDPVVRTIDVRPAPEPAISGVDNACQGSSRTYTTQSGMTDYQWSVSAGTITAGGTPTDNTVTILWDTDGAQSVSVYYTDGTGCTSATVVQPVTVYLNAQPEITGNFAVCRGSTERYETEPGMTSYAWIVSSGGTITGGGTAADDYVEITWNSAGARTLSVNYVTPDNCTPASATVQNITVNELPEVTCPGDLTVCINETPFALSGGNPAGGTYSGTGVTAGNFDASIAGLGEHTITYEYTDGNSCTNTCTFTITVDPVPSVATQYFTICSEEPFEIDLDALVPGGNFTWTASQLSGASISGFSSCNSSCDNTISQVLVNNTYSNQGGSNGVVRYTVTAEDNNCFGTFNIDVTVRPVISPRNISWNSNFDQNTYEVCVGGSVLNDNDLDIYDPYPSYYQYDGYNPQWEYAVTPDGPWLPAPGQWENNYRTTGRYQWIVASELMSQVGTYYFRFSITDGNGCISSSDIVDVRIISTMVVDAGEPDYICTSSSPSAYQLTGASVGGVMAGGTPSARWSAPVGSFSSTALTTEPGNIYYTPPANYVGEITLTLTTNDPAGACTPLTDTRTIYMLPEGDPDECLTEETWDETHSNSDGSFSLDCGIRLTGSNNGSGSAGTTQITNCSGEGTLSFDWLFTAPENRLVWHTGDQKAGGYYNSSTVRVDKPGNLEEGDLIIVTIHFTSNPGTISRPSGFNVIGIRTNPNYSGATVASFWKIATAADLGGAGYFTFTANTVGYTTRYLSVRVTGFDESNPIGDYNSNIANGPPVVNNYRTITVNSVSASASNSLLVAALTVGGSLQYPLSPADMNTVFYGDDITAARVAIQEISGSSGDRSFTWPRYGTVNSSAYAASAQMFIINPATPDEDAAYYLVNGSPVFLSNTNGSSGSVSIPVNSGDEIGFRATTSSNTGGPGELIIFNLEVPNDIPELTGETEILVEGCQDAAYEPAFVEPTVADDCGIPEIKDGYPQDSEVTENGCERIQTRTWVYVDDCGEESEPFTQTITWTETDPIAVTCPDPVELAACTDQADIQVAYDAWKDAFTFTGGCGNVTDNKVAFPPLTDLSCGGYLEFTLTVTDECGQEYSCTSNFEVLTADDLEVTCPTDPVLPACSSLAEIEAAYTLWASGFSYSGGCAGVTTNRDELPEFSELQDLTCGGQVMFTYRADYSLTGCEYAVDCIATFTVEEAPPIEFTVSPDVSLPVCSTTEEIETAYNNWVAGFTATGGCNVTDNIADIPALPENMNCGDVLTFTYTADNGSGGCTQHAEGTSTFSVTEPPALTVECPADPNLPGCSDPVTVAEAYNTWVDGFRAIGGCDVVTNIADIPPLDDLACQGQLEFEFTATNGSGVCPATATCSSTFTIGEAEELIVSCPLDEVVHGCTPEEIQTDFDNWIAGFTYTGGCNATETDLSFFTPPATCGGTLTIQYEVTDICGNVGTCSSSFTVEPLDLAVTVPDDAYEAACQTQDEIDLAFSLWLAEFDYIGGCGVTTTDFSTLEPPNACGGTIIVNYSASDICGQVENGSAIFTIHFPNDVSQEPTFNAPADITIFADADCEYNALPSITGEPTNLADNCGEENLTVSSSDEILPGSCNGSFIINRTWTVTDNCMTETSHVQVITVEDNTAPVFTYCPEDVDNIPADENLCEVSAYTLEDPVATDNCGTVTITWEKTGATTGSGTGTATGPFNVGETTITYTATDACGNTATCIQTVTIVDAEDPVIIECPEDVTVTAEPPDCDLQVGIIDDLQVTDNCGDGNLVWNWVKTGATEASGTGNVNNTHFNVGITTVTYTVEDVAGNTATCSFTVTVLDERPPVVTSCNDEPVVVAAGEGSCEAEVTLAIPEANDPCGESFTIIHDSEFITETTETTATGIFPVGEHTITWTITDVSGNSATCIQEITVTDTQAPTISCPTEMVEDEITDGGCTLISTNIPDPVTSDNCGVESLTYVLSGATTGSSSSTGMNYVSETALNVGITTVIYTVTDVNGLTNTCEFDVWIKNLDDPQITVTCLAGEDATIRVPAETGLCDAEVTVPVPEVDNVCNEIISVTYNGQPATLNDVTERFDVGVHTVTWVITDASGNEYSCVITVEVTDVNATLACPPDIERAVDEGEVFASNVQTGNPTVTNNCEDPELIWTLVPPTDYTSEYDPSDLSGTGTYTEEIFWLGVTTITYSLTDAAGNVLNDGDDNPISCSFTVTVTNQPVIECPEEMEWDASETCDYEADPGVPTLITGSHPLIWTYTIEWADGSPDTYVEFDEVAEGVNGPPEIGVLSFPVGTTTITWTATDQFGNTASCEQLITVTDNTPPTFVPPPDPFEDCVDMLHQAVYDPVSPNPVINHNDPNLDKFPSPDFHTFEAGNTALDLDMTNYADNCCAAGDTWSLRWQIDFTDVPNPLTAGDISNPPITGTGQPSTHGSDIQLWGDGVYYTSVTHTITYWITDCHDNESEPIIRNITITPRPQIIKITGP
jgi:hypothetical protein